MEFVSRRGEFSGRERPGATGRFFFFFFVFFQACVESAALLFFFFTTVNCSFRCYLWASASLTRLSGGPDSWRRTVVGPSIKQHPSRGDSSGDILPLLLLLLLVSDVLFHVFPARYHHKKVNKSLSGSRCGGQRQRFFRCLLIRSAGAVGE